MATNSGLPPEMPRAPGNRHAGEPPPKHVTAVQDEIPWMAADRQKWTREKVDRIDERLKSRAGRFEVGQPQQKPVPGFGVL